VTTAVAAAAQLDLPATVPARLVELGWGAPVAEETLHGGTISRARRIRTSGGRTAVLKTHRQPPPGFYRSEAVGLDALRGVRGLAIPEVLLQRHDCLLLEDLGAQEAWNRTDHLDAAHWEALGRGLAHLHGRTVSRFGFAQDTYWGPRLMDQRWQADGYRFYAEQRYLWLLARPGCSSRLSPTERRQVERIAGRLPELVPPQPPSLSHGDFWGGNRAVSADRRPGMIDPSAHYGWAEAELAHCLLWGGFAPRFYEAYAESRALAPGWRERNGALQIIILLAMVEEGAEWCLGWLRPRLARFA
jgi:fructosamine-3-kinase